MIHHINPRLLTRAVKVILVGAGGTGSHVLRRLATIHMAMIELGHPGGLEVLAIDPDTVSKTNIGRQAFYPSDLGQSKAAILVNRCNLMMQTKWKSEQSRLTDTSRFAINPDIVIGCVDNRKARAAILESIKHCFSDTVYWLDIGNREHDGQVILGEVVKSSNKENLGNRLPHAADLYPQIIDEKFDETDDTPSCSLAESLERQSLFINDTLANQASNLLWELFRFGQISHHGQFVNIKSGRVTPLTIDPVVWSRFGYSNAVKKRTRQKKVA